MASPASSPSVYSQSSYPASSSLRTPSPLEPLPPTHTNSGPLTCLDIYHEWFSEDMPKPERRNLLAILRRRRAPLPQPSPPEIDSSTDSDSDDPLTCVDLYREWFAQEMALKNDQAHRRRLLDILTDGRERCTGGRSRRSSSPQLPPRSSHFENTHPHSEESHPKIHAPQPILGWSPTAYWNDATLASWSEAAAVARTDDVPCRPSWDLWDRMQAHSWNMICLHPQPQNVERRGRIEMRDSRIEEIRRRQRMLLLEELMVRCDLMTMNGGMNAPPSRSNLVVR